MAIFNAFRPFEFDEIEDWDGAILSATGTQIVESDGFRQAVYSGTFIYGAAGDVIGGTLTSIRETRGGQPLYAITNIALDAQIAYASIEFESPQETAELVLSGNDIVNGSSGADFLVGLDGNDQINGGPGPDTLEGGEGNDTLAGGVGSNMIIGGRGFDTAVLNFAFADAMIEVDGGGVTVMSGGATTRLAQIESFVFTDRSFVGTSLLVPDEPFIFVGDDRNDTKTGGSGNDSIDGGGGDDALRGRHGADTIIGGDGNDTLDGGFRQDGSGEGDLRDLIYGGAGDDVIDGDYGNDELWGQDGNDTIEGGFGVDFVLGGAGNDVITGSALSDLVLGGDGSDFINGGFGFDRVNGGNGADRFFHAGIGGHGSDWIQDFDHGEGDRLVFGGSAAVADFQVNFANTASAGASDVAEAFIIYRPTGQILWALIDAAQQDAIILRSDGSEFDLLA